MQTIYGAVTGYSIDK